MDLKDLLPEHIRDHYILSFDHGSYVYGTNSEKSDRDIIVIVDDNINLSDSVNGILEIDCEQYDFQIINEHTFIKMIYDHHIIAVESMFMQREHYSDYELFKKKYSAYFILDKWKLRQVISAIVGNSYAKCHKKLVVKDDYDLYRAQKSIFHCIRLYMFAIQLASTGKIYNYAEANAYWYDIKTMGSNWEEYKVKYKPVLNELRSTLVKYCPKPND